MEPTNNELNQRLTILEEEVKDLKKILNEVREWISIDDGE